ncbi:MAG: hypothetical protein HZA04_10090 [Nitrospinae bacterium]|nr:hypothetical protein [Nitrospinota bacterium]
MSIKGVDFATLDLNTQIVKEQVHPKVESPPAAKTSPVDYVDVHKKDTEPVKTEKPDYNLPRAGNQYRYTVDSEHDVVVKVRDIETRREVKEIPTKAYQAFKRAYNKVVARFIDRKA